MSLTTYRTLGRSGLIVSPLSLGTMTFGTKRWGADEDASRAIFDAYVDAGGNVVDTADVYSGGTSETMVGRFVAERGLRDSLVLATKAGFGTAKHPHSGGNGAKHIHDALDGSLRRLQTDHIDLYWLHVWDMVTPAEEVLQTMAALVRAGKIRYWGLSNAPAWYVAQITTLAVAHALPRPIALQFEYSLIQRGIENEHIPAAAALGLGIQPWSPLGGGFLSGKYRRDDPANVAGRRDPQLPDGTHEDEAGEGRLAGTNPFGDSKFTPHNWEVLDALESIAREAGTDSAAVALAWLAARPGVDTVLIGASRVEQIVGNIAALNVELSLDWIGALERASAISPSYPGELFSPRVKRFVFGGNEVIGRG